VLAKFIVVAYNICANKGEDKCNEEQKEQVSHIERHAGKGKSTRADNQDGNESHEHGSLLLEVGLTPVFVLGQKGSSLLDFIVGWR